jgi:hypothetical protein
MIRIPGSVLVAAVLAGTLAGCGGGDAEVIPAARSYPTTRALADDLARAGVCRDLRPPAADAAGFWTCTAAGGVLSLRAFGSADVVQVQRAGGCWVDGPQWMVATPSRSVADEVRRAVGGTVDCR